MSHDISLSIRRSTVNQRCLEIIKEIVNDGRLATVEFVVQVLLHRHRVSNFTSLNVGNISDIPSLLLLVEIFRKVSSVFSYIYVMHVSCCSLFLWKFCPHFRNNVAFLPSVRLVHQLLLWLSLDTILSGFGVRAGRSTAVIHDPVSLYNYFYTAT